MRGIVETTVFCLLRSALTIGPSMIFQSNNVIGTIQLCYETPRLFTPYNRSCALLLVRSSMRVLVMKDQYRGWRYHDVICSPCRFCTLPV